MQKQKYKTNSQAQFGAREMIGEEEKAKQLYELLLNELQPEPQSFEFLQAVARAVAQQRLSEATFFTALDGVKRNAHRIDNPIGYFRNMLRKRGFEYRRTDQ